MTQIEEPAEAEVLTPRLRKLFPEYDIHIGKQLELIRLEKGVSQPALAAALGISFQQLQKYEIGQDRLSASSLYVAARFLQVSVRRFYDGLPPTCEEDEEEETEDHLSQYRAMIVGKLALPHG